LRLDLKDLKLIQDFTLDTNNNYYNNNNNNNNKVSVYGADIMIDL